MTIVLIRHAETDMAGRFCGHSDPALNAAGEHQAICVAEEVSKLDISCIHSSDLRRASQTAAAISQRTGIAVNYLTGLREIHFGQWEGLAWQEIELRFPEEADLWLREFPWRSAPDGEGYMPFTERVDTAIATLLRETAVITIAVVTHRGVMRYALTKFFGFAEAEAWASTAHYGATVIAINPARPGKVLA
ncbi:MAG: histidine phosphatase family protein [Terracidiphilus sp.]